MSINLDTINIALIFVTGINLIYGLVVFLTNPKDKSVRLFSGVVIGVMFWTLSMFLFRAFQNEIYALLAARFLYLSAATIPLIFLYFTFVFPDRDRIGSWGKLYLIPLPFLIMAFISIWPNLLIKGVILGHEQPIILFNSTLHLFYAIYIISYFSWAYVNLFIKFFKLEGIQKTQIIYVIAGTLSATMVGVITNLIMPLFGVFIYNWMGQIAVALMVILISYAILKHHLFNIKVVLTEILTVFLWALLFSRVIISTNIREQFINSGVFLLSILLGIFIIRSVLAEVASREEVEKLANDLRKANERLQFLDKQKSEFVSIASHQLRSPLTAIKGYTSMLLEGSFGFIEPKTREAVDRIFQSAQNLVGIVDDLLNITRLEQGRMEYAFEKVDLSKLTKEIVDSLYPNALNKKLGLTFENDKALDYFVNADLLKIRQVILNLVDNAIKYTREGAVKVNVSKINNGKGVRVAVADTGVGITPELRSRLFEKFSRGDEVSKLHTNGTGLGLYIAKQMIEAHKGTIGVNSEGEGKGSVFYIEIPVFS